MRPELSTRERNRRSRMREQVLRRCALLLGFEGDYDVGGDAFIATQMGVRRETVRKVRSGSDNFSAATVNKLRRALPSSRSSEVDLNILTGKVADIKETKKRSKKSKKKRGKKAASKKGRTKKKANRRPASATVNTPSLPCVVVLLPDGKQLVKELPEDAVIGCGPSIEWDKGRRSGTVSLEFARKRTSD